MRHYIIIFIFFPILLQAQNYIPIHIDSLIQAEKEYQIIKWDDEDVVKMDSIYRPPYYKGGALLMPLKKYSALDTVLVADISGIDRKKVTFSPIVSKHSFVDNKFMMTGPIAEISFKNHSFFKEREEVFVFYSHRNMTGSGFIGPQRDYVLLPGFESEFPYGLPQKQVVIFRTYYDFPFIISWEEWEKVDQSKFEKSLRPNPHLIYHRDEEYIYYIFEPGYYSEWNEENKGRRFITKLQIALKERNYNVPINGEWNRRTHIALIRFQKDFFLYKNTYEELLEELGIGY